MKEGEKMKNSMNTVKGVAAGMAAGMLVGFTAKALMDDSKKGLKKKANKVMNTVEDMADTVKYIFK